MYCYKQNINNATERKHVKKVGMHNEQDKEKFSWLIGNISFWNLKILFRNAKKNEMLKIEKRLKLFYQNIY